MGEPQGKSVKYCMDIQYHNFTSATLLFQGKLPTYKNGVMFLVTQPVSRGKKQRYQQERAGRQRSTRGRAGPNDKASEGRNTTVWPSTPDRLSGGGVTGPEDVQRHRNADIEPRGLAFHRRPTIQCPRHPVLQPGTDFSAV